MSCYRPLDGYRMPGGSVKIGWEPPGSTEKLRVPCGSCFGCRMEYAEMWSIRCQHEARLWPSNLFVTLTYDDENLPWHRSLVADDLTKFLKRLRRRAAGVGEAPDGSKPIRYFAAGEYGTRTGRPHFHILLFNLQLPDARPRGSQNEVSGFLSDLWKFGHHTVSGFTPGRARYAAGYASKKVRGRMQRERHYSVVHPETGELHVREPEFSRKSLKPGLGYWFFERYRDDFLRGFVVEEGGVKKRLPRFYLEKLLRDESFAMAHEERRDEFINSRDPVEDSPERNAVKERVHRSRAAAYGRERSF